MELTPTTKLVRSSEVMAAPVDDELVMMHLESSQYLGLNPMGRRIWELLAAPVSAHEICQLLLAEFEVSPDVCQQEVLTFLTELHRDGVIQQAG